MSEEMTAEFSLEIDESSLSDELSSHAAKLAYVSEQAIKAELNYNEFKLKVEELYAMLDKGVRAKAEEDKKKITEKVVENEVKCSDDYKKAAAHLLRLKAHMDIMKARREAWKERGSMLVQMSSNTRAEMEAIRYSETREAA